MSAGRWSWCLVPLSGPPVGFGRLGLFLVLFPGPVSSFVSEKRLWPRTQEPVFSTGTPFTAEVLTYDLLGRGFSSFCRSFPIVLSFLSPSVAADAIRQRLSERSSSTRPLWLHVEALSFHWHSLILSRRFSSFSDAHAVDNSISSPLVTV